MLPPPKCAGTLKVAGVGACPPDVQRFKFSCLACRMRRAYVGKFTVTDYITYTYTSFRYVMPLPNGRFLLQYPYVLIDPRGHFTMLRCAAVIVLDKLIRLSRRVNRSRKFQCRPWVEFAEFLANFPVW